MTPEDYIRKEGYVSLTEAYFLPDEQDILDRAIEQLRKGDREYYVYYYEDTAEIYIKVKAPCSSVEHHSDE